MPGKFAKAPSAHTKTPGMRIRIPKKQHTPASIPVTKTDAKKHMSSFGHSNEGKYRKTRSKHMKMAGY